MVRSSHSAAVSVYRDACWAIRGWSTGTVSSSTTTASSASSNHPVVAVARAGRAARVDVDTGLPALMMETIVARPMAWGRSPPHVYGVAMATPGSDTGDTAADRPQVGVGPLPRPWPEDPRLDPELLAAGDRRNVADRYRYWRVEAIRTDLAARAHPFHVAIENWQHDFNIGTIVRNANAFLAHTVHIVGKKRWNRRGAMVTDRYQHIEHHASVADFGAWARREGLPVVGIDIVNTATPIETNPLPESCVLVFGQEGPGLSEHMVSACDRIHLITQFGSTRSINVGVASGIAMHEWTSQHARISDGPIQPS